MSNDKDKKFKRTYTIAVYARDCDYEFKQGMGVGVLASQEVDFELTKDDYQSFRFLVQLDRLADELREEVVRTGIQRIVTHDDEDEV